MNIRVCILNVRTEKVVNNTENPLYRLLTNEQDYVKLNGGITQGTMKLHYFITVNINELTIYFQLQRSAYKNKINNIKELSIKNVI